MMPVSARDIGTAVLVLLAVLVLVAAVIKVVRGRRRQREALRQERIELAQWYARSGMVSQPPTDTKP